jgi:hypothetical protein
MCVIKKRKKLYHTTLISCSQNLFDKHEKQNHEKIEMHDHIFICKTNTNNHTKIYQMCFKVISFFFSLLCVCISKRKK